MARLPRLQIVSEIVDNARRPSTWFQRFWQSSMEAIERAIADAATAQTTGETGIAAAATAQGAASSAQADATQALTDASAAQAAADAAQADIDALAPTVVLKDQTPAWAAATGTASRATFDTATATTADLAQRLAALIADLKSNGALT